MLTLSAFSSGFWIAIGVLFGIIVFALVILFVAVCICFTEMCPKMKIYKGDKLVKEMYAPMYKEFRKYLDKLEENDSLVITTKPSKKFKHPIKDLLQRSSCRLDKDGELQLVGCMYLSNLYLTITQDSTEGWLIRYELAKYLNGYKSRVSDEKYEKLKKGDWWKMERKRNIETSYMVCTITRTTLPEPKNKPNTNFRGGDANRKSYIG